MYIHICDDYTYMHNILIVGLLIVWYPKELQVYKSSVYYYSTNTAAVGQPREAKRVIIV